MLSVIFNIFLGILCGSLLGYWIHWLFHKPYSLWFYAAHMNHHEIQYPSNNFLSTEYRSAGKDNSVILFIIAFLPIIIISMFFWLIGLLSFVGMLSFLTALIAWGLVNNYLHDQFHILNSICEKLPLFNKWRKLHKQHHIDMKTNFGICIFVWDRLFRTFKENSNG